MNKSRPGWNSYFIEMAFLVSKRSTCLRRQVGAILVKDKHILATGYNGAARDLKHCEEIGCLREKMKVPSGERHEICRGLHAEQNAIIQAAKMGVIIQDAVIYTTHKPCILCAKMLINSGIKEIFYVHGYPDELSDEMLKESGIKMEQIQF